MSSGGRAASTGPISPRQGKPLTAADDRVKTLDWVDRGRILIFAEDDNGIPYDLRSLDVTTGLQRSIWQPSWGYAGAIGVNSAANLMLVVVAYPKSPDHNLNAPGLEPGLYLASATGRNPKRIADVGRWSIKPWDNPTYPFVVARADEGETAPGVYAVSVTGELVKIIDQAQTVSLPESTEVGVFYGRDGLAAFGERGDGFEQVLLTDQLVENVYWLSDGAALPISRAMPCTR